VICWGILGAIEHVAIQLSIPEMRSNVKGLYWILKEKKLTGEKTNDFPLFI
jgi:CDP-diacylglycerol--glycerol-3-phosphate 3-phosphatidyltransferase